MIINKEKLSTALSKKMDCKKYEAEEFLNAFIDVMRECLLAGDTVKIVNLFRAEVKEYKGRIGRNPKTGESVDIPSHKKVKITASEKLNRELNGKEWLDYYWKSERKEETICSLRN